MKKSYRVTAGVLSALIACGALTPAMAASISKDDTVYATLQPNGKVDHQTVSSWLHSDKGLKNFADVSDLQDITNLKGDELPQQRGNALIWNVNGNDVYYQGTSNGTLPVEAEITYTLDGKQIDAAEIEGAKGHLVITVSLKNNESKKVTIDGKEYTIYKPYFTVIGTDLSTDVYQNIKAEKGKIENDSSNQVVGFLAMPGMKDMYGDLLGDELSDLTDMMLDTAVIECDITEGEVPTLYFACAGDLNDLNVKDLDMDSTFDDLDELKDATQELIDGAKKLADGCSVLDEKLGELTSNYVVFHHGIIDATSGAGMLDNGAAQLASGMKTLSLGADTLAEGAAQLDDGAKEVASGAEQVNDGAKTLSGGLGLLNGNSKELKKGANQLADGLNLLGATLASNDVQSMFRGANTMDSGLEQLADSTKTLAGGLNTVVGSLHTDHDSVANGLTEIYTGLGKLQGSLGTHAAATANTGITVEDPEVQAQIDALVAAYQENVATIAALNGQLESIGSAAGSIKQGSDTVKSGAEATQGNINTLKSSLEQLSGGLNTVSSNLSNASEQYSTMNAGLQTLASSLGTSVPQMVQGAAALDKGISQYTAGVSSAAEGAAQLVQGTNRLSIGAGQLSMGVTSLHNEVPTLIQGVKLLDDGAGELGSGTKELSAGMKALESASSQVMDAIQQFDDAGTQLADGSGELYDGIMKYNEEGISQITENETLTNLRTASKLLEKQKSYAREKTCYSGAPESVTETTSKFIMRTEAVQQEDTEEDNVETEEKSESLWDRIIGLF